MIAHRMRALLCVALVACGSPAARPVAQPAPVASVPAGTQPVAPPEPSAPLWSEVKKGVLPNGLTYYILKHGKPEKRAMLWLAVNAGSVEEDDDQKGLAHFDEHMAFNGTRRFPKLEIVNYLQSIGMRFGADLNAYTTWQETVYQLEVPTEPAYLGKGLDILHDWAGDVTYDPAEVKSESGVVLEEWRLNRGAGRRLFDKHVKVLFKGTRYADRITIGDDATIKKADREALFRFYKDWYRPDDMAVVAVGDFDPEALEKEIQARLGDLHGPEKDRPRPPGGVPTADGTRISIVTDKELPSATVQIENLIPRRSDARLSDLRRGIVESLYEQIVNERFRLLGRRPDVPFVGAGVAIGAPVREIDAFSRSAQAKNGKVEDTLRALLVEALRVERHGVTRAETQRAKIVIARSYDESADRMATRDSRSFAAELVRNFLTQEAVPGPEAERDYAKKVLPEITVEELNADMRAFGGAENRVVEVSLPDGESLAEARVREIVTEVEKADIPPWEEQAIPTALMTTPPTPGKIVKDKTLPQIGVTVWKLSNGATVVVKPTDFEKGTVSITADALGGNAAVKLADYQSARFATQVIAGIGGVGAFDADTLGKVLAGKQVGVQVGISETSQGFGGSASPKDLETEMQLIYLRMTAPRKDAPQFAIWKANSAESLANQARSPEFQFAKQSREILYKGNPRRTFPGPEDYEKIDLDKALAFYKDRFGDAADLNVVIVGEVDLATLRPLVETYLASLPGRGRHEKEKDLGIRKIAGVVTRSFPVGIEPKASVRIDYHGDDTWSHDKERDAYFLSRVLTDLLREDLREEKGGVYGVSASAGIVRAPHQERSLSIGFGCAPERVDELVAETRAVIARLQKTGVDDDHLERVRQIYLRSHETDLRLNRYWTARLATAFRYGDDPNEIPDTTKLLARMTNKNLIAAARHFLDEKNVFTAVQLPALKAAP